MSKKEEEDQPGEQSVSPHPTLRLRHTLQEHTGNVYKKSLSPTGSMVASPSEDTTVRLWDLERGRILQTLIHKGAVICTSWSPNGKTIATGTGGRDNRLYLWDVATGRPLRMMGGYTGGVYGIAWSPDGEILASCSKGSEIHLWNPKNGRPLGNLKGHSGRYVMSVAWAPHKELSSVSLDFTVILWNVDASRPIRTLKGHKGFVFSLDRSPDGRRIASGSDDKTVRIWDVETGQEQYVLEGHIDRVVSVSFVDNGRLLASLGENGTLIIWRSDTWDEVLRVEKIGITDNLSNLAFHRTLPVMVAPGYRREEINVWELNFDVLRNAEAETRTVFYVNAKAVLLGESGVGKSGLGIRLAEGKFRQTESTHGAQFWHFSTAKLSVLPPNVRAELTLWDLAGQPEYRLTHQLFLDDTDAALLLFDCSDANDPFRGVAYWAKVLKKHAPPHAKKFLVSARCDVSPVTVDRLTIIKLLAAYGLDEHFKTSAKTNDGVELLFHHLLSDLPWDQLPRTSTPKLFQIVREFLLERKQAGANLMKMEEIRQAADTRFNERAATQAELDTVIQLLQSRGLIHQLEPRPGKTWVLLKPERINQYGASIIQAARNHPKSIGAVPERDVLTGNIAINGFERLPEPEELLVLESTVELLIRHDLGFREMGYLVFPSQINITRQTPDEGHPRPEVAYRFSGSIETIYASLVVRLSYTDYFRREDQWKYAVEFSRNSNRLGFLMRQVEEGTGDLEIYFQSGISAFDRVTFIRFITEHLRSKGIDIKEQIRLYCPNCTSEVINRDAIEARIRQSKLDIPCQFCDTAIIIPKSVEEIYQRDPMLVERQKELAQIVEERTEAEVKQFRVDQQQYTTAKDQQVHILHLSDLHFEDDTFPGVWRTQLETDLKKELGITKLEYLVLSGDIANRSTEEEYDVAFAMVDGFVKPFGLDASRVLIVPGNHDLNWELSEEAYPFVPKRKLPPALPEGRYILAGDAGALLRDEDRYRNRFGNFNKFYRRVYVGQDYPTDYSDQFMFVERDEDRILFLGLNSSWHLDHHFRDRPSIYMPALSKALDRLQDGKYDGWLKVAVWHHPVSGKEMMNDEFMQLLAVHGFQLCLHGHIHEAIENFHQYDERRGIHIIGAGTFGAPARERVTGIPLQYNLLTFDPRTGEMIVNTRKKEKTDGAWSADARWGDKNNPSPSYRFQVKNYQVRVTSD